MYGSNEADLGVPAEFSVYTAIYILEGMSQYDSHIPQANSIIANFDIQAAVCLTNGERQC